MISVPYGTDDIRLRRMIYASHMISASRMEKDGGQSRCLKKINWSLCHLNAVSVVDLVDNVSIPKSSYMTEQLARAGTSIGANIYEAQYAQSKKDFVSKLEIALKESNEVSYWLKLLIETHRIDEASYLKCERLCGNIRRLLIASCRTAKIT